MVNQHLPVPPTRKELEAKIEALPPLPSVANELLGAFNDDDADIGVLSRRIAADQVLAARTLRVANSAFYGLQGKINSIQEAIVVLGFRAVRSLVISAAAVCAMNALKSANDFAPRRFWRHSIGTAVAARQLAQMTGHNPDSAFAAGLLHDIGQLVLAVALPKHYNAVIAWRERNGTLLTTAEQTVLNCTHTEAGQLLASRWKLPDIITESITLHHRPEEATADSLAGLVHVANALAHGLGLADDPDELVPPLSDLAWSRLNIAWDRLPGAMARIEGEFEDTLNALTN